MAGAGETLSDVALALGKLKAWEEDKGGNGGIKFVCVMHRFVKPMAKASKTTNALDPFVWWILITDPSQLRKEIEEGK